MSVLLGILLTLVVFSLVVFIHELGHFLVARLTGMKVEEFGIGIPPRARTLFRDKHGTIFSINWLPIGGFVRIAGENPSEEIAEKNAFSKKSWLAQSAVLLAGVTMNFVFAFLIFLGIFLTGAKPIGLFPADLPTESYFLPSPTEARERGILTYSGDILFSSVSGSIAENAGIATNEHFRGMEGDFSSPECSETNFSECTPDIIITEIEKNQPITFFLEQGSGGIRSVKVTPENGKIGSYIFYENVIWDENFTYPTDFGSAVAMAGHELRVEWMMTAEGLGSVVRKIFAPENPEDREEATEMLSGPIGIGSFFVEAIDTHLPGTILVFFIAMISISLGFFNLLPIPGLDGGRFVTLTLSKIITIFSRGKIQTQALETRITTIGIFFLLLLFVLITFLDISKFF